MNANSKVETIEVINFGKFKGTALVDLNHGYVNWLLSLDNLNEALRKSLEALSWVQEANERERAFQKRKALAIGLQSSHIPLRDRRAYKKRMGWVGA
ncbi:hypothetical protein [Acinetobacter tandoii]|uniref:Uncharacterized protein n=1 Tax=Acinetobacter tandoii DSM 14970 = CIP 107469 TaxID=1120927 RepID=R9AX63_9GAMM|nr:hypothetical protein [Acinetobacter tandoii]EOR06839.1 hypothetical protein I593_01706 [Acinetobacter tandoii DSM 14970 = CIP 107469]